MVSLRGAESIGKNIGAHKKHLLVVLLTSTAIGAYFKPQQFLDLWLTRDQQGGVLFIQENYAEAAQRFQTPSWQAFSFYGAEDYGNASDVFGQYTDLNSRLAQANTHAHAQEYVLARNLYRAIADENADYAPAQHNLALIQGIIDEINATSESQQNEGASKELADAPQRADGADKQVAREQLIEQYSADQLLLDPALNEMWLRQVQKDPSRFLAQKFAQDNANNPKPAVNEEAP